MEQRNAVFYTLLFCLFPLLGGCTSAQLEKSFESLGYSSVQTNIERQKVNGIEWAVRHRDLGSMYSSMRGFNGLPGTSINDYEATREAYEILSRDLYFKNVNEDSSVAAGSLSSFDQRCSSRIGVVCSEEYRNIVSQREREQASENEADKRERLAQLRNGTREVSTLHDAQLLYNPSEGRSVVLAPKATGGDGRYYQTPFRLTDKQGDNYVSWFPDVSPVFDRVGMVAIDPEIFGDARYKVPMVLVGRYVRNVEVQLLSGRTVVVPVFDDAMLFPDPSYDKLK